MFTFQTQVSAAASVDRTIYPRLRIATFEDHEQIARLELRNGLPPKKRDEWLHLWIHNPAYRNGWPIGWVLESQNGEIVGSVGNIPVRSEFRGETVRTATGRAWVVDAPYRGYALLLMNQFFQQADVDLLVNTTVNAHAYAAYNAFNAIRVPVPGWEQSLFWITDYRGFARSFLATKSIPLRNLLSYPTAFAFYINDVFRGRQHRVPSSAEITVCSDFDEQFDDFWQLLRSSRPALLLTDRSREALQWHYHYAAMHKRLWIFTVRRNSKLVAYAIYYRQDTPEYGLKRMRLADFQQLDPDFVWLAPMLLQALDKCREEGVHMLEVFGLSVEKQRILSGLNPYRRRLPSWMYFYTPKDHQLEENLKDAIAWDPCCYDGDASL